VLPVEARVHVEVLVEPRPILHADLVDARPQLRPR
jgi:hypothetical protein